MEFLRSDPSFESETLKYQCNVTSFGFCNHGLSGSITSKHHDNDVPLVEAEVEHLCDNGLNGWPHHT